MREKGAVVGPDTFLARTLFLAVRLSGKIDRWEGAKWFGLGAVGCGMWVGAVGKGGLGRGIHSAKQPSGTGPREGQEQSRWLGCINQLIQFVNHVLHPHKAYSVYTHSDTRTSPSTYSTHHVRTSDASPGTVPHIGWGRGRILPLRIHATVNLASAVGPSSSHLQQFQTAKRTIDDPIAHFPRLSFRTSFSFSPFGFTSVAFVTRYQPVAQSLFHRLSHREQLGGTCHCACGMHTFGSDVHAEEYDARHSHEPLSDIPRSSSHIPRDSQRNDSRPRPPRQNRPFPRSALPPESKPAS